AGSMKNVAVGGAAAGAAFAYYETIAGGAGGGPERPGASAIHTHMTNTMNTPIEALEAYYPLRVQRYAVRRGSGGRGRHRGGDGVVRELEFLAPAQVTLLAERRRVAPYGLRGGSPGSTGEDWVVHAGRARRLPAKTTFTVEAAGVGHQAGHGLSTAADRERSRVAADAGHQSFALGLHTLHRCPHLPQRKAGLGGSHRGILPRSIVWKRYRIIRTASSVNPLKG